MDLQDDLLAIEQELWTAGPDAYRAHLHPHCLIAFGPEMAGVSTRDEIADSVAAGPRWRDLEIEVKGLIQPHDDVVLITYRARAARGQSERYQALVSSGYVRRDGGWRLMFHQQARL